MYIERGCAGFIGFHFSKFLIEKKLDNLECSTSIISPFTVYGLMEDRICYN